MEEQFDFDLETVRKLAALVEHHQLTELTVELNGTTVQLVRHLEVATEASGMAIAQAGAVYEEAAEAVGTPVLSPAAGVYYRSPSPDVPLFVKEGDTIEKGQVIGLIEAMKTFNEIPSPVAGKVLQVIAQNGQLVSIGDPLIMVEPVEEPE